MFHFRELVLGCLWFCWLAVRYRSLYRAERRFYHAAQQGDRRAIAVLIGPFAKLATDYTFALVHRDQARISERALAQYADASLSGYGDWTYTKGGETIPEQQRGLVLAFLEPLLAQLPPRQQVVERLAPAMAT